LVLELWSCLGIETCFAHESEPLFFSCKRTALHTDGHLGDLLGLSWLRRLLQNEIWNPVPKNRKTSISNFFMLSTTQWPTQASIAAANAIETKAKSPVIRMCSWSCAFGPVQPPLKHDMQTFTPPALVCTDSRDQ
jgi:hypothetical protein